MGKKSLVYQKIADLLDAYNVSGRHDNLTEDDGKNVVALMRRAYNQGREDELIHQNNSNAEYTHPKKTFDQWLTKRYLKK